MADLLRVMISQPMRGRSPEAIEANTKRIKAELEKHGYKVVNTTFKSSIPPKDVQNEALYYMGLATLAMSKVDAVLFADGWKEARGCRIENQMATNYGLKIMYEKEW